MLGVLAPVAVHLLQVREVARLEPERPAQEVVPGEVVDVVAALAEVQRAPLRMGRLWAEVAKQGG